jgi:hypothetical protein
MHSGGTLITQCYIAVTNCFDLPLNIEHAKVTLFSWIFLLQVKMRKNNMDISFPHQLFIDNQFMDASNGAVYDTINPTDESVRLFICGAFVSFRVTAIICVQKNAPKICLLLETAGP